MKELLARIDRMLVVMGESKVPELVRMVPTLMLGKVSLVEGEIIVENLKKLGLVPIASLKKMNEDLEVRLGLLVNLLEFIQKDEKEFSENLNGRWN